MTSTATSTPNTASTPTTGRVQLALSVSDLQASIAFPPLKLVLLEGTGDRGAGVQGALNHLGVEVAATSDVQAATGRLTGEGLDTLTEVATECCYAVQDKVWVHDPDGAPWEVYTVLADAPAGCC